MRNQNKYFLSILFFFSYIISPLKAQSDGDLAEFFKEGENCYKKGLLKEAALEFENILLIDKTNFQARIWLAQIYIDKKDLVNARKLLTEASIQSPNHPKVKALQKLIGNSGEPVKQDLVDPVIAETLNVIASATKYREYGLVIPEDKVIEENLEKKLIISTGELFKEKKEVTTKIKKQKKQSNRRINNYSAEESNPLLPVFEIYKNQGLSFALDKYFEILAKDPTIASKDDRGLIDEGFRVYALRFAENPNDLDNRFYYGILQYINGYYDEALDILKPFRANPGKYASTLRLYFNELDRWSEQENIRLTNIKIEEEQRLAREAREREKIEAEKNDVWAQIKQKSAEINGANKNDDLAVASKAEAVAIHTDGYKLYKKGKLDEAIAKLSEAVSKDRNNPEYNYHLGLAYMDKGLAGDIQSYDNAINAYQKVISLAPDSKMAKDASAMIKDIQGAKGSLGE